MATQSGITKTASGDIIPKLEMENFEAAILKLESIEVSLAAVDQAARSLEVKDQSTFTEGGILVAQVKNAEKDAEDELAPFKKIIKRAQDFVRQREQRVTNKAKLIRDDLNAKMGTYARLEEQATADDRKREQDKADAEKKRQAEVKRLDDLKAAEEAKRVRVRQITRDRNDGKIGKREYARLLKEAGALEEAQKADADASAEEAASRPAPTVKVATNIPTVSGVVKRRNFKATVRDIRKLETKYLKADEVSIGIDVRKAASACGEAPEAEVIRKVEALIPGIEVTCDRTF